MKSTKKNKRHVCKEKNKKHSFIIKIKDKCEHFNNKNIYLKNRAPGEDRTHDLQIALVFVIMRLTRCLLRYRGR